MVPRDGEISELEAHGLGHCDEKRVDAESARSDSTWRLDGWDRETGARCRLVAGRRSRASHCGTVDRLATEQHARRSEIRLARLNVGAGPVRCELTVRRASQSSFDGDALRGGRCTEGVGARSQLQKRRDSPLDLGRIRRARQADLLLHASICGNKRQRSFEEQGKRRSITRDEPTHPVARTPAPACRTPRGSTRAGRGSCSSAQGRRR